jgi:hypothetical protein
MDESFTTVEGQITTISQSLTAFNERSATGVLQYRFPTFYWEVPYEIAEPVMVSMRRIVPEVTYGCYGSVEQTRWLMHEAATSSFIQHYLTPTLFDLSYIFCRLSASLHHSPSISNGPRVGSRRPGNHSNRLFHKRALSRTCPKRCCDVHENLSDQGFFVCIHCLGWPSRWHLYAQVWRLLALSILPKMLSSPWVGC